VSKTVRNLIEEDKTFTDLIVAGDNYYPSKKTSESGEKQKTISTSDWTSGFNCLDIQGVTTYMLWGNHDLDNSKKIPKELFSNHQDVAINYGDYLMAMTGATIGKVARYTNSEHALLNQRVCRFDS
jgi:hypothetical protein